MLQVSPWTRIITLLIVLAGILIALPNALPDKVLSHFPSWLPSSTVSLGLDLQGGSYLLLEVQLDQVQKDKAEAMIGDIRSAFRKAHIGYTDLIAKNDTVSVKVSDLSHYDEAKKLVSDLNPAMTTSVLSTGAKQYDMTDPGNGVLSLHMTDAFKTQTQQQILEQSIEVVRRRIDEMGTREPTIERQGEDRILVQVPGLQDPDRLKTILGKTAKMSFQLVDETADPASKIVPIGDESLPQMTDNPNQHLPNVVVQRRVMVSGDRLTDAGASFDQRTGQPVVTFRFDSVGAREFGDVTKENVNHRFAIVLDKQVISAPNIQEPILGGSGEITGNYTTETANNLSILLRAGALPAPLRILEERTVGAELGADSVKAGRYSAVAGLVMVAAFMILRYGLFGIFADIALTLNVVLLLAALTAFGATLTLPGIAGIVLTMGMAVDANVLIYERIREEQRNGRSMLASIDTGFRRAMTTIIDANMTHLIASLILFQLGSGSGERLRRHPGRGHHHILLHRGDGDPVDRGGLAQHRPDEEIGYLSPHRSSLAVGPAKGPPDLFADGPPGPATTTSPASALTRVGEAGPDQVSRRFRSKRLTSRQDSILGGVGPWPRFWEIFAMSSSRASCSRCCCSGFYVYVQGFDGPTFELFTLRWLHIICGVMWIGLLWYFNFVSTPTTPKIPEDLRPALGRYITPAALWWFRWSAMGTILFGIVLAFRSNYLIEAYTLDLSQAWPAIRWCRNISPSASACGWAPSCGSMSGS